MFPIGQYRKYYRNKEADNKKQNMEYQMHQI